MEIIDISGELDRLTDFLLFCPFTSTDSFLIYFSSFCLSETLLVYDFTYEFKMRMFYCSESCFLFGVIVNVTIVEGNGNLVNLVYLALKIGTYD